MDIKKSYQKDQIKLLTWYGSLECGNAIPDSIKLT